MQIFISYAREDYQAAKRLFDALKRVPEIDPWLDKEQLLPGAAWEEEIVRAIGESQFIIVLLSENSLNKRGFVQKEVAEALERFKRIPRGQIFLIPARLDASEPRQPELAKLNWVDLFEDWERGVNAIVRAISANRPTNTPFDTYVTSVEQAFPWALPIIQSHRKGAQILRTMYSIQTHDHFPRVMSIDGEIVHNPLYAAKQDLQVPLIIGPGPEAPNIRLMLLDLHLIKGFNRSGQPLLLQYYSGTQSAGWQTWLFPHGLGFQRNFPGLEERMKLNARDIEVTTGLPRGAVAVEYAPKSEFLVSVKPDFGYRYELVIYCFFFCVVRIDAPPRAFLRRKHEIRSGTYPRRFRWFYFEELQNDTSILSKNADVIKAVHTIYGTSLVPIPQSIAQVLNIRE